MAESPRVRILVVDDERVIADTLAVILALHGYQAFTAYNGQSGLERAQELNPELIISDVVMPGINGIDMAVQIRQFLPSCKIILFSGQAATADLLNGTAKDYKFEILSKPVHPRELLEKLERLQREG